MNLHHLYHLSHRRRPLRALSQHSALPGFSAGADGAAEKVLHGCWWPVNQVSNEDSDMDSSLDVELAFLFRDVG